VTASSVELRATDGAVAEIHLFGAHVTSWRPAPGDVERLFLSSKADLTGGSAIRGGIPVIFPQFGPEGPLVRHGFARVTSWSLSDQYEDSGDSVATFLLQATDATRAIWPADFVAELMVRVGGPKLDVTLSIQNTGTTDISFTCALHTYLRVHHVAEAEVVGLHGARYRIQGEARDEFHFDNEEAIHLTGELDRIYLDAPPRVILRERTRELVVAAESFPDLVLWVPGSRAAALADMEEGGEQRMVCIEAAAVQEPVILAPERKWSGTQTLVAVPMPA
jgi:glucose-6-phosphate 1-epimerase